MNYKHCCVVDADGVYKTFVLVLLEEKDEGEITETVQGYKIIEGEKLLDTRPPINKTDAGSAGFVKPRWDEETAAWVEGATKEEVSIWESEHPAPTVDLDAEKEIRIAQSKTELEAYLLDHPILWTDG